MPTEDLSAPRSATYQHSGIKVNNYMITCSRWLQTSRDVAYMINVVGADTLYVQTLLLVEGVEERSPVFQCSWYLVHKPSIIVFIV